jgi:hypothetical protein
MPVHQDWVATIAKHWTPALIVSEFPPLFEEFRAKRWALLWQGSRDGFRPGEFRRRANTLTLIQDTKGEGSRQLHAAELGDRRRLQVRRQPAEFLLHAEEAARRPAPLICAESEKEAGHNQLRFRLVSSVWRWLHSWFR